MVAQIVFVHGVANRISETWSAAQAQRDQLLQSLVFGEDAKIINPYWGHYGANPGPDGWLSLPSYSTGEDGVSTLGLGVPALHADHAMLAKIGVSDFEGAVDALFAQSFDELVAAGEPIPDTLIEASRSVARLSQNDPLPSWIRSDMSDAEFIECLLACCVEPTIEQISGYGFRENEMAGLGAKNWIAEGAARLRQSARNLSDRLRNAGSRYILSKSRNELHTRTAAFIGDILVYLKPGEARDAIRETIATGIREARKAGSPTYLVGHSLGGVTLSECLMDEGFCEDLGIGDGDIEALITIGSQSGLFEELSLLDKPEGTSKPVIKSVRRWINILDETDILSFRAEPFFDGVEDFAFSGGKGLLEAHTSYFKRPSFYTKLHRRLREGGARSVPALM